VIGVHVRIRAMIATSGQPRRHSAKPADPVCGKF
jgi:hypothetical protein